MTRRKYEASVGTVSEGTMRTEDLLDSFTSELVNCRLRKDERNIVRAALAWLNRAEDKRDDETGSDLVEALFEILDGYSPPYCRFGANEGDGSDYGFWPCMDAIDELPRVDSSDDARRLMEDCAFVNDHGNVIVFNGRGEAILELV